MGPRQTSGVAAVRREEELDDKSLFFLVFYFTDNQFCGDFYGTCSAYSRTTTSAPTSAVPAASWIVAIFLIFFGCVCPIIWCCFCKKSPNATAPDQTSSHFGTTDGRYGHARRIEPDSPNVSRVWSIYNDEGPPPSYEAAMAHLQSKNEPVTSVENVEETSRL